MPPPSSDRLLASLTRVQLAPPSLERNNPPALDSIIAHTSWWSAGETARPTLPMLPFGKPGFRVISVHFSPPSVLLKMPLPAPPLMRSQGVRFTRHIEAYSTF